MFLGEHRTMIIAIDKVMKCTTHWSMLEYGGECTLIVHRSYMWVFHPFHPQPCNYTTAKLCIRITTKNTKPPFYIFTNLHINTTSSSLTLEIYHYISPHLHIHIIAQLHNCTITNIIERWSTYIPWVHNCRKNCIPLACAYTLATLAYSHQCTRTCDGV